MPAPAPRKPVIGISIGFHEFGDYLGIGFQRPVALAGGVPVMLPRLTSSIDDLLDVCDGIVLPGGRDIIPSHYGHDAHEALGTTDPGATISSWSSCARRWRGASRSSASAAGCRC